MSIYSKIEKLPKNQWKYKNDKYGFNFCNEEFPENYEIENFKSEYLSYSGKGSLEDFFSNYQTRNAHVFSVFFIGVIIYNNTYIKKYAKLKRFSNEDKEYRLFPFIWFLTALMHDLYFDKENVYTENNLEKNRIKDLEIDKKHVPTYLSSSLVNYYNYRKSDGKQDHGVVAGAMLYKNLCDYRKSKEWENKEFWQPNLVDHYFHASQVIAVHNIWMPKCKDVSVYCKAGLNELVENRLEKVNYINHPLLFLLGLVDTIDPVKLFDCAKPEYVLNNVDITCTNTSVDLTIDNTSSLNLDRLDRLKENLKWLDCETEVIENRVIITFNK